MAKAQKLFAGFDFVKATFAAQKAWRAAAAYHDLALGLAPGTTEIQHGTNVSRRLRLPERERSRSPRCEAADARLRPSLSSAVRASLIVNPYATRVTEERVRWVEERLGAVETLLTERRGHATELAAAAAGDAVFVFGGDGVVNEVLNGLPDGEAARDRRRRPHERARAGARRAATTRRRRRASGGSRSGA